MYRMSQAKKNSSQFTIRAIALSCLFCFVIAPLLTTVFIIAHTGHDCHDLTGENCLVCLQINNAQKLLNRIAKAATILSIVIVGLLTAITVWVKPGFYSSTLVGAKIRMNN